MGERYVTVGGGYGLALRSVMKGWGCQIYGTKTLRNTRMAPKLFIGCQMHVRNIFCIQCALYFYPVFTWNNMIGTTFVFVASFFRLLHQ